MLNLPASGAFRGHALASHELSRVGPMSIILMDDPSCLPLTAL